jgi:hypothetical protein
MGDFNNVPTMEPHFLLEKFGMRDAAQLQGSEATRESAKGQ